MAGERRDPPPLKRYEGELDEVNAGSPKSKSSAALVLSASRSIDRRRLRLRNFDYHRSIQARIGHVAGRVSGPRAWAVPANSQHDRVWPASSRVAECDGRGKIPPERYVGYINEYFGPHADSVRLEYVCARKQRMYIAAYGAAPILLNG